jgi:hypothetical protein
LANDHWASKSSEIKKIAVSEEEMDFYGEYTNNR